MMFSIWLQNKCMKQQGKLPQNAIIMCLTPNLEEALIGSDGSSIYVGFCFVFNGSSCFSLRKDLADISTADEYGKQYHLCFI